jgi:drug/metabolite transporter (DMT)-like permease
VTQRRTRWAAYASVYVFWGSTYPAIRYLVRWVPPFLLSGARLLAAGLLLLALAHARGAAWPTRRQWLGSAGLGMVFLVLCNGVASWGLQYIGAGRATLITACVPLVALAYGWAFQGRQVGWREGLCMGLGLLGVGLLVRPGSQPQAHWAWGLGAIVWAVTLWGVGIAEARRFPQASDAIMASGAQMASAGCVLLGVSALLEAPGQVALGALPQSAWGAWAFLVLLGSCAGYLSFHWLIQHEPPQLAGTYAFVNPVVAVLLGWAFLAEPLGWATLAATGLIVAAVAGLLLRPRAGRA